MDIFSELKNAQAEQLATDPASHIKGRIYSIPTAPVKIDDGTLFHKVLTDKMYPEILEGIFPSESIPSYMIMGHHASNPSISASITSTTFVDITNGSITFDVSQGRSVEISLERGELVVQNLGGTQAQGTLTILRDGITLGDFPLNIVVAGATQVYSSIPASAIRISDTPTAGTHTYKIQGKVNAAPMNLFVTGAYLKVKEIL